MNTRERVTGLALQTLAIARGREVSVLEDQNPEGLHAYRVALRRLRSLLASLKEVYPPDSLLRWKSWLWEAARATGRVRDFDVYLEGKAPLLALLPAPLHPGVEDFFDAMAKERANAFELLCEHLRSEKHRSSMGDLAAELAEANTLPPSERSHLPVESQAADRIAHRLGQLRRAIRSLTAESPDEELHETRILGKKLRYLLDFFGDFFPGKNSRAVLKSLSRLQNRLGRFNDITVQQQILLHYAADQREKLTPRTLLALGGLITLQAQDYDQRRQKALKALAEFAADPALRRFRKELESAATPSDEPTTDRDRTPLPPEESTGEPDDLPQADHPAGISGRGE